MAPIPSEGMTWTLPPTSVPLTRNVDPKGCGVCPSDELVGADSTAARARVTGEVPRRSWEELGDDGNICGSHWRHRWTHRRGHCSLPRVLDDQNGLGGRKRKEGGMSNLEGNKLHTPFRKRLKSRCRTCNFRLQIDHPKCHWFAQVF